MTPVVRIHYNSKVLSFIRFRPRGPERAPRGRKPCRIPSDATRSAGRARAGRTTRWRLPGWALARSATSRSCRTGRARAAGGTRLAKLLKSFRT